MSVGFRDERWGESGTEEGVGSGKLLLHLSGEYTLSSRHQ